MSLFEQSLRNNNARLSHSTRQFSCCLRLEMNWNAISCKFLQFSITEMGKDEKEKRKTWNMFIDLRKEREKNIAQAPGGILLKKILLLRHCRRRFVTSQFFLGSNFMFVCPSQHIWRCRWIAKEKMNGDLIYSPLSAIWNCANCAVCKYASINYGKMCFKVSNLRVAPSKYYVDSNWNRRLKCITMQGKLLRFSASFFYWEIIFGEKKLRFFGSKCKWTLKNRF